MCHVLIHYTCQCYVMVCFWGRCVMSSFITLASVILVCFEGDVSCLHSLHEPVLYWYVFIHYTCQCYTGMFWGRCVMSSFITLASVILVCFEGDVSCLHSLHEPDCNIMVCFEGDVSYIHSLHVTVLYTGMFWGRCVKSSFITWASVII